MERLLFYSSAFAKAWYTAQLNYDLFYQDKKTKAELQYVLFIKDGRQKKPVPHSFG
jgi:hypothetical protein